MDSLILPEAEEVSYFLLARVVSNVLDLKHAVRCRNGMHTMGYPHVRRWTTCLLGFMVGMKLFVCCRMSRLECVGNTRKQGN